MNKENNDIINKFLLVGDKFMPELHLYQHKIGKYSACGPFNKHKRRIKSFMQDDRLSHICKNELDKACFQHDMAYNKYKDIKGRTQSDIVLKNKAYKIATNPKFDSFQRALASMVWKFLNKRSKKILFKGSGIENQQLAENFTNQSLESLKEEKCILYLKTIFGVWI